VTTGNVIQLFSGEQFGGLRTAGGKCHADGGSTGKQLESGAHLLFSFGWLARS
jgi:hypothetical protein